MHILLTRPLEDSREMIFKFQSLGHDISHIPLINIESKNYESINFSDFNGIIFTSANAIKFLNLKLIDKKINCFCVGNATEKKAKSSGFQNIFCADGNVNSHRRAAPLPDNICAHRKVDQGQIGHEHGRSRRRRDPPRRI